MIKMPTSSTSRWLTVSIVLLAITPIAAQDDSDEFRINDRGYFSSEGVDVMAFDDFYPEGHQGGVSIIMHDERIASNGDIRLEAIPGQWAPVPRQDRREMDSTASAITTWLSFPDPDKNRKGFNPIEYPDLEFAYSIRVEGLGESVQIIVDLDQPLPDEWIGEVGFNLELYPTSLFGKGWLMDDASGSFPRQAAGGNPIASGSSMTVAPDDPLLTFRIRSSTGSLQLWDQRLEHNNGWFIVREEVPAGATTGAIVWTVEPNLIPGWRRMPVIQVSQVGYHPNQTKTALVEFDRRESIRGVARLFHIGSGGSREEVLARPLEDWGEFLRYRYGQFDFTDVTEPGLYRLEYGGHRSHTFRIGDDVFADNVWQPTLEYFLPVQMCHMRVEEKYRVWHGLCHLDDARMAPTDHNHFDGYIQRSSTLSDYEPGEHVPGLNRGGWHDAGDDDLRIESQADEVFILASAYELFGVDLDQTSVDQEALLTRIHEPDGTPDLLQQIEHGVLTILGPYRAIGRLYRGIIVPTLPQYRMIGDWANQSDNVVEAASTDDRLIFTEEHPAHELTGIAALAIAGRVLADYRPELALECLDAAEALWHEDREIENAFARWTMATVELLLSTGDDKYRQALLEHSDTIVDQIGATGWSIGRALPAIGDEQFSAAVRDAVAVSFAGVEEAQKSNPYGVPYEPYIWGAGWGIQRFGVGQYFLHRSFPDIVSAEYMLNALNFVLGVHPGRNTDSYASGVGAESVTIGYGFNRADWSYIPGGVVSGTALIRPNLPELKDFPFLWQQAEYVMGGGATHFMFLAMAADDVLNR